MARQRCAELATYQVPGDRIHILLNRQERGGLSLADVEQALDRPVFATLPNDYKHVRDAIAQSRLVDPGSRLGASCLALARTLSGLPKASRIDPTFGIMTKLRKVAS